MASSSLRICHLADIHLGYRRFHRLTKQGFNQREADVNLAFRESIDRCIALQPQIVIIAGDLFHSVRPSNAVITFAFRELRRLAEQIKSPIVIIAGNHDTPRRSDSGSLLRLFSEIPHLLVADTEASRFDFADLDLSVMCLPHAVLADFDAVTLRADERRKFNVLVAHGQFDARLVSDFGGVDIPFGKLVPHEWDYMAFGHVHARLDVGTNGAYAGAVEHTGTDIWRGATERKGFLSVELPTGKRVFHDLTSPREVVVAEPIDGKYLSAAELSARIVDRLEGIGGGIDGKIVRLELENVPREVFRALDHRALRGFRARALNLSLDVRPPVKLQEGTAQGQRAQRSLTEELQWFAKEWPQKSSRTPQVVSTVERFFKQIEEDHEARSA